jgi:hypothetical protein
MGCSLQLGSQLEFVTLFVDVRVMRPGLESLAGMASMHLDVYPQRHEHSWDGYMCATLI